MKKSEIKPEEMVKDLDKAINLIGQIENIDLEKDNLIEFKEKLEEIDVEMKEKYKNIIEESTDNLDSEE